MPLFGPTDLGTVVQPRLGRQQPHVSFCDDECMVVRRQVRPRPRADVLLATPAAIKVPVRRVSSKRREADAKFNEEGASSLFRPSRRAFWCVDDNGYPGRLFNEGELPIEE